MVASVTNPLGTVVGGQEIDATDWNGVIDTIYNYLNNDLKTAVDALQAAPANPLTTKGDLMTHNGTTALRKGVGTNGQVVTANSAIAEGWEWAAAAGSSFVAGMIMLWSGSIAAIPSGWALCDGVSGRPNLQGLFIAGAGNVAPAATGGLGLKNPGDTGGVLQHQHINSGGGAVAQAGAGGPTNLTDLRDNIPPYYALAYIIKT